MATILLIDDDEQLAETLSFMLEQADHEVVLAENGVVGVRQFQNHAIDLVITDLIMPEQEGIETIMALRRLAQNVPIIAISGRTSLGDHRETYLKSAALLGAQKTLTKPFTGQELMDAVNTLLESQAPAS